jgi:lactam utilization protein B
MIWMVNDETPVEIDGDHIRIDGAAVCLADDLDELLRVLRLVRQELKERHED